MKHSYPSYLVRLGHKTQVRQLEYPKTSGTMSGSAEFTNTDNLEEITTGKKGGNFAGERLAQFLYQPGERERTEGWNDAFYNGGSLEGNQWTMRRQEIADLFNPPETMPEEEQMG